MGSMYWEFISQRYTDLLRLICLWHFQDQNYLIPRDIPTWEEVELNRDAINAQDILNDLSRRKPYVIIFLLDCCRGYHLRNPNIDARDPNVEWFKIRRSQSHAQGWFIDCICLCAWNYSRRWKGTKKWFIHKTSFKTHYKAQRRHSNDIERRY